MRRENSGGTTHGLCWPMCPWMIKRSKDTAVVHEPLQPADGHPVHRGLCNLLGNYETAYHCLVARGELQVGETVLIHGASGSTGLAVVHVAKLLGATVIATGRSDDKLAIVRAHGADHVINCGSTDGSPGVRRFRDEV